MTTTCGVTAHDESCLCDVEVGEPAPILYNFTEVRHADVVARATGYKEDEGGEPLAAFLVALGSAYEASRRYADFDAEEFALGIKGVREALHEHLRAGRSIVDAPEALGESEARIYSAMTNGQASKVWIWDQSTWLRFEMELLAAANDFRPATFATRFDAHHSTIAAMAALYGVTPLSVEARWAALGQMRRDYPNADKHELSQRLADVGIHMTPTAVRKALKTGRVP